MLLQSDAKQLEWIGATFLSQDQVAIDEIWKEADQHEDNRQRFNLPSRLIAKVFVFRLIYGGSAYSYANDPDFKEIGNETFWQGIIDEFYTKYSGLKKWHSDIVDRAKRDRKLVMPTGRVYSFQPEIKYGAERWPRTQILNYPVQGLGADLMAIARVSLRNRIKGRDGVLLVNTIHDSIILDIDEMKVDYMEMARLVDDVFSDIPENFKRLFGVEFNLPMRVDSEFGYDLGNMSKIVLDK